MEKRNKIIYYISTGLFSAIMLMSAVTYLLDYDGVAEMFESLGVPVSIIYPLAAAKILGLIAIWTNKVAILRELAYLGFAVDVALAVPLHAMAGDGLAGFAFGVFLLIIVSYIFQKRMRVGKKQELAA